MSENKMDNEQIQAAEPVEPVLNTIDFTDELSDEALDRDATGGRYSYTCTGSVK